MPHTLIHRFSLLVLELGAVGDAVSEARAVGALLHLLALAHVEGLEDRGHLLLGFL